MAAEQLPLDHVHHKRRLLASRVVSLEVRLGRCASTTREVDAEYKRMEKLTVDELVALCDRLGAEAAKKRGGR